MQSFLLRDGWETKGKHKDDCSETSHQNLLVFVHKTAIVLTCPRPKCCTGSSSRTPVKRFHRTTCTAVDWCNTWEHHIYNLLILINTVINVFGWNKSKCNSTIFWGRTLFSVWCPPAKREGGPAAFWLVELMTSSSWCWTSSRYLEHTSSQCIVFWSKSIKNDLELKILHNVSMVTV